MVCRDHLGYILKSFKSGSPPRKGRDPGLLLPTPSILLCCNASSHFLQTLEEEDLFIQVHSYRKEEDICLSQPF